MSKCGICKKSFEPETKSNGTCYKTCSICREKDKMRREMHKCEHGRQRSRCKDCGGSSICEHDRERSKCKDCGGSSICEHGRIRSRCKDCGGSSICEHGRIRSRCITCTPKRACQNCLCVYVAPNYRFKPYCFTCYCVLNPGVDIPRKYMLKEHHLRNSLIEEFKDTVKMIFDKPVEGGCSNKRPDILIDNITHSIVIECDENQHKNYSCENKREMELFKDLGDRPLVMIRLNPDSYIDRGGRKVPGCFTVTKTSGFKPDKKEWERRLIEVINRIKYYMSKIPEKELTHYYLFHDES